MTAWEHLQMTRSRLKCTTGSKALDELLGGGIETHAITELVGEYGAGKTQLCLNLCVRAQLKPEEGGLGGGVLFFDTEGTFSSERIYQIASHNGYNPDELLHNITISRVYTSDYLGREALSERQQRLNLYLHKLLRLAEIYGIAVVITNQAQAEPVTTYTYKPVQGRPAGGNIMAHASNTRVWLKRSKGSIRIARVFDSPWLPEGECPFRITEKGIEDVEEEEKKVAKNAVEAEASP
jgi:DNA repair protein RadA